MEEIYIDKEFIIADEMLKKAFQLPSVHLPYKL